MGLLLEHLLSCLFISILLSGHPLLQQKMQTPVLIWRFHPDGGILVALSRYILSLFAIKSSLRLRKPFDDVLLDYLYLLIVLICVDGKLLELGLEIDKLNDFDFQSLELLHFLG